MFSDYAHSLLQHGILEVKDGRYFIFEVMREVVLEGGRARTAPHRHGLEDDPWYRHVKQAVQTNRMVPEAMPPWLTSPDEEGDEVHADDPTEGV